MELNEVMHQLKATLANAHATEDRLTAFDKTTAVLVKRIEEVSDKANAILNLVNPETAEAILQNVEMHKEIRARREFEVAVQKSIAAAEARLTVADSAIESVRTNVITMLFTVIGSLVAGIGAIIGFGITILKAIAEKQFVVRERVKGE